MNRLFAYILPILTAVLPASVYAQSTAPAKPRPQSYIGAAGGGSFLFGPVTRTDYADPRAGFVKSPGWYVGLEGAYFFRNSGFGLGGSYTYARHGFSHPRNLSDGYAEDFAVDSATVTAGGPFSKMDIVAGPTYALVHKKFTFDFRVYGGITHMGMPQIRVDLEDNADATFYQKKSAGIGFAVQLGAGVHYSIIRNLSLGLRADYRISQPQIHVQNENRANNAGRLVTDYRPLIMGLQTGLSLSYRF